MFKRAKRRTRRWRRNGRPVRSRVPLGAPLHKIKIKGLGIFKTSKLGHENPTEFTVIEVFDGDTFRVSPSWKWGNRTGDIIRPTGYDAPEEGKKGYEEAKQRLTNLILNKKVDIRTCKTIDDHGRLVADVYYAGKNLADYFPEYKI